MHLSLFRADRDDEPARSEGGAGQARLEELYDRHGDTVYRVCLSMTGSRADAEDALHTVFLKLLEKRRDFRDVEHEKAFLIAAARNCCRDIHRRRRRGLPGEPSPEPQAAGPEADSGVADALTALPPEYRLALYLHYYEGYRVEEIAAMLGQNANTVKTRLRRARARLKLELEDE